MNYLNSAILDVNIGWLILAALLFAKFSQEEFDWTLLNEQESA